jgi:hypothetical protein
MLRIRCERPSRTFENVFGRVRLVDGGHTRVVARPIHPQIWHELQNVESFEWLSTQSSRGDTHALSQFCDVRRHGNLPTTPPSQALKASPTAFMWLSTSSHINSSVGHIHQLAITNKVWGAFSVYTYLTIDTHYTRRAGTSAYQLYEDEQ